MNSLEKESPGGVSRIGGFLMQVSAGVLLVCLVVASGNMDAEDAPSLGSPVNNVGVEVIEDPDAFTGDRDDDGFLNSAEIEAGTDPDDPSSYPNDSVLMQENLWAISIAYTGSTPCSVWRNSSPSDEGWELYKSTHDLVANHISGETQEFEGRKYFLISDEEIEGVQSSFWRVQIDGN